MPNRAVSPLVVSLAVAAAAAGFTQSSRAETIYALTTANSLIRFDSSSPGAVGAPIVITGLGAGENLVGIDFRPASTGSLFGVGQLGNVGSVYQINLLTGAATSILSGFGLTGSSFGVDFNPVPNALRIVSDSGQNLRITAGGGGVVNTDTPLNPGTPTIGGAAYSNNVPGGVAGQTTLYEIDYTSDTLVTQGSVNFPPGTSPNTGTLFTVGALGVNTSSLVGLDISALTGTAFASLTTGAAAPFSSLYTINLASGAATLIGAIGSGTVVRGIAVSNVSEPGMLVLAAMMFGVMTVVVRRRRIVAAPSS